MSTTNLDVEWQNLKMERGLLFNYGEKSMHTERYLYIPEDDDFVLLNKKNLKLYITGK